MGLRFRKSVKLGKGVKLNLNKNSAGLSFGTKGARYTVNSSGRKTATVGIPGTGLSYTEIIGGKKKSTNYNRNATTSNDINFVALFMLWPFYLIGFIIKIIVKIIEYIKKRKDIDK